MNQSKQKGKNFNIFKTSWKRGLQNGIVVFKISFIIKKFLSHFRTFPDMTTATHLAEEVWPPRCFSITVHHAHYSQVVQWKASPELNILCHGQLHCPWEELLEIVTPWILLIGGDSNVDRVYILISLGLMDVSSWEVEKVPSFQCNLKDRLSYLILAKVWTWNLWQLLFLWSKGVKTGRISMHMIQH